MRVINSLIFTILILTPDALAQDLGLIGGKWEQVEQQVFFNEKNINFYKKGEPNPIKDLSKIRIEFKNNGEYTGINISGYPMNGTWSLENNELEIDGIRANFEQININEFTITHPYNFTYLNDTLTAIITTISKRILNNNTDCTNTLNHSNTQIASGTYHSKNITSKGVIESDSSITYKAEQNITLNNDFHAKQGSDFIAKIEDCPNSYNSTDNNKNLDDKNTKIVSAKNANEPLSIGSPTIKTYPNPTSNIINIEYSLPKDDNKAKIDINNFAGKLIKTFDNLEYLAGTHKFSYDVSDFPSGLYICVLRTGGGFASYKLLKK